MSHTEEDNGSIHAQLLAARVTGLNQQQADALLTVITNQIIEAMLYANLHHSAASQTLAYAVQYGIDQHPQYTRNALSLFLQRCVEESRMPIDVDDNLTLQASHINMYGEHDEYYHTRMPRDENFQYPQQGDEVIALCNYNGVYSTVLKKNRLVKAGTHGTVNTVRKPNTEETAYVGCWINFTFPNPQHEQLNPIQESILVPWDCIHAFKILTNEK